MLQLNIKSSNYMCLDIDPDSVIHKHLVKKLTDESWGSYTALKENDPNYGVSWEKLERVEKWRLRSPSSKSEDAYHSLTMLPSFHISLGAPDDETVLINKYNSSWEKDISFLDIVPIIGDITLAPIVISEKDNKKSAWIPLNPHWFECLAPPSINKHLNDFDNFDHRCDECPVQHLHVSIANLTGEPRDSIARPEDCIIDTITA